MNKKIISIFLAAMLLLTACGKNDNGKTEEKTNNSQTTKSEEQTDYKSPNGNTMVLTLFQNPKTLDIQKTNADYFIPLQIYNRLVDVKVNDDGSNEIVPSLAEKWEISEDGKTYTFYLRKGVKFHNGEELKADDVLFTIEKMMDPKEAAVNTYQFEKIEGALDKLEGKATSVSGVKVIDDYTVSITLEKPFPPFLASLTGAPASIYNRKAVEEGKDKFGFDPEYTVGTGYMKFKDWAQDKEINLVRNDDYFEEKAHIDGVRYLMNIDSSTSKMMLENGELDFRNISATELESYKENPIFKDNIVDSQRAGMDYISFNQNDPNMAKVEVRKAVSMAIDRDLINKTFYNGEGTIVNGVLPPGIPGYEVEQEKIEYNPEKAKELLKEAGLDQGLTLISLQNATYEEDQAKNEMIQAMLKEIGIDLQIKTVDATSYYDILTKGEGYSMSIEPVTADVPDPDDFYLEFTVEAGESNGLKVKDKALSDEINKARFIVDPEERIKALTSLDKKIVGEQALYLPLVSDLNHFAKSPRLEDFKLSWQGWVCGSTHDVKINPNYNK